MTDALALMLPTPAEPPNGDYDVHPLHDGQQMEAHYPNGYGASVVQHGFSYGGGIGKFELAVLRRNSDGDWPLCYTTPLTDDVIGWLDPEEVVLLLHQIARLPNG